MLDRITQKPLTANASSMKDEDGILTIKDAPSGAILIHAQYDSNGVLLNVTTDDAVSTKLAKRAWIFRIGGK